jgi:hypothetical protein
MIRLVRPDVRYLGKIPGLSSRLVNRALGFADVRPILKEWGY